MQSDDVHQRVGNLISSRGGLPALSEDELHNDNERYASKAHNN
jgi:hypothetical protein